MTRARFLDLAFRVTVFLKGLDGVLELVGGALLLFLTPERIHAIVRLLTQHELSEDPTDPVAGWLLHWSHQVTGSATLFGAFYLIVHGLVKVVLVWAVLRDRLWAYPWMLGFLVVFIGWQGYELARHFSWGLFALTVFDVLIVALTVREYRVQLRKRADRAEGGAAVTPAS
ncbi:DUF2127 domain-containing protein [Leifsonia sp. AG29]|uniref:DUF2127 domain-containing protein n=1 Tax=Leifsonia sp. AG29 TaxID=2598860 RepID=UPI00131B9E54|nr:DUF2127 domain-containing protein [Leifsonia sp. AG29]